jgi:tRNA nucleotidyltransferase (CCA-adding enzyme)
MCAYSLSQLTSQALPLPLEALPQSAYLVGGAVRDALLGRRSEYLDLDFVLPQDAVAIAREIASRYHAGFVVLDAERQIARVVFEQATVDFALASGDSLETDLQRRDFTINAIAYNPHTNQIIDPLQGIADLKRGIIRMVSRKNLQDDPLRLLRAYRQAAQLNFIIEPETRSTICEFAPLLSQVAAERVQTELSYLLRSPQGSIWLKAAWEDNFLSQVLHKQVTAQNLSLVAVIDSVVNELGTTWQEFPAKLESGIPGLAPGSKRTWLSMAKLASLLGNVTPTGLVADNNLEELLENRKYSRAEIRAVSTVLKALPQLQSLAEINLALPNKIPVPKQYFFFQEVGQAFSAVAVLGVASGIAVETIAPLIDRYCDPNDQVAHPTPLVTGNDLIQAFSIRPSPHIGQLLNELQLARAEGRIFTREEALALAAQLINSH